MIEDNAHLLKRTHFPALFALAFLSIAPLAHADSILVTFQFSAGDLINDIHNTSTFTAYQSVPVGYYAIFLQPTSLTYGTYGFCPAAASTCQEPAPIDPSTNSSASDGFTNTTYADSSNPPQHTGSDGTTWIAFLKSTGATVTILGDPASCGTGCSGASLVGSYVGPEASPNAPVGWGSSSQQISSVYSASGPSDELFQFSLVLPHTVSSVSFQGYTSVVAGRSFKSYTQGIGFNMTLTPYSQTPVPEPAGSLLAGISVLCLGGMGLVLRKRAHSRRG